MARLLRAHGFDVAVEPESFLVTKQNQLVADESSRAGEWASKPAAGIAPKRNPARWADTWSPEKCLRPGLSGPKSLVARSKSGNHEGGLRGERGSRTGRPAPVKGQYRRMAEKPTA
jgi:hypothetical protein